MHPLLIHVRVRDRYLRAHRYLGDSHPLGQGGSPCLNQMGRYGSGVDFWGPCAFFFVWGSKIRVWYKF